MNRILPILSFVFLFGSSAIAQLKGYTKEIDGIKDRWHSISLDVDVLTHAKYGLGDVRVFGIEESGDTITAPYFKAQQKPVKKHFRRSDLFNVTQNKDGFFYTF